MSNESGSRREINPRVQALYNEFVSALKDAVSRRVAVKDGTGRIHAGEDNNNFISGVGLGTSKMIVTSGKQTGEGDDRVFEHEQVVVGIEGEGSVAYSSGKFVIEEVVTEEVKTDSDGTEKLVLRKSKKQQHYLLTPGILTGEVAIESAQGILQDLRSK